MSSKVLDYRRMRELQPASLLWSLYKPEEAPFRFQARNEAAAKRWQGLVRRKLGEALGFQRLAAVPFEQRVVERVDRGAYVREKIILRTTPRSAMPVYMLIPKQKGPLPVMLAFHGHGYGVKDIVGLWEDGSERTVPDGGHKDFAVALCRRGLAVAAPEIACFGERQTDFSRLSEGQTAPTSCAHAAALAAHLGGSALGMRVFEARRLIDYLAIRRELDARRLGAMGLSGGGMLCFFASCMDTRIRAAVISGYFAMFRHSIHAMSHCLCNYVPGLHVFGEICDIAGLLAPRPILIEAGSRDAIFPIRSVRQAVARTTAIYRVFGAADRVLTDYFEGRHQVSGRKSYDFLAGALGADGRACAEKAGAGQ